MADSQTPLIVSVSGIRGIVGESLTPDVVTHFAAAFGSTLDQGPVVLSRDGRATGEMFRHAAIAGLTAVGCDVLDVGVAATPTCGFYVKHSQSAGGIQITASHNPPPYNGLKLFRPEGFVLSPAAGQKIADAYRNGAIQWASHDRIGKVTVVKDPHAPHIQRVLSLVDVDAVRRRKFRVVLDANHASGAVFAPRLLEALGCEFTVLGATPDGQFEHMPEPTEVNLKGLCEAVKQRSADVGFAVDPDADRLAVVDGSGRYIGEEYTLALAIRRRLRDKPGPVVINGSTSRVSEDVAVAAGAAVSRSSVGEVHVAEKMLVQNAIIGGEGNGGVIDPRVGMGRDSAVGVALILELLAIEDCSLSDLMTSMPRYHIRKEKFPLDQAKLSEVFSDVREAFADGRCEQKDGLRVDWQDRWVQIRASNTEPIVRVIAEAKDPTLAATLCNQVRELIRSGVGELG